MLDTWAAINSVNKMTNYIVELRAESLWHVPCHHPGVRKRRNIAAEILHLAPDRYLEASHGIAFLFDASKWVTLIWENTTQHEKDVEKTVEHLATTPMGLYVPPLFTACMTRAESFPSCASELRWASVSHRRKSGGERVEKTMMHTLSLENGGLSIFWGDFFC